MYRTWAVLLASVALVFLAAGAGGRSPVARLLAVKGKAIVVEGKDFERPATVYGTIYADERLVVGEGARVTLVFRGDGHIERVVASGRFRVTEKGCRPQSGVEQVAMSKQNRATVAKVSKGKRGIVQAGVVMARSAAPTSKGDDPPPRGELTRIPRSRRISPIPESTLLSPKPAFSWSAVPKANKYTLTLYFLGNRVWSTTSENIRVEYSGKVVLNSDALYTWDVTTTIDGKAAAVCEGSFHTASDRQREDAAALRKLLAQAEPAYLALAAMFYRQNGMKAEAIAINEQLARLTPEAAIYGELVDLYYMAGREQDARAAENRLSELEKKAEDARK
jgi:hypothetical protein